MRRPVQAIVLAAGRGTRMRSGRPKVLQTVFGEPLLEYPLRVLQKLGVKKPIVVVGWGREPVRAYLNGRAHLVVQSPQLGTGHAVRTVRREIARFHGDVLIWPADMPLVQEATVKQLIREHQLFNSQLTILSSLMVDPTGYGRILRRGGQVAEIREESDATDSEKRIHEVNTGVYLFKPKALFEALEKIRATNRKKEYYLTDTACLIYEAGGRVQAFPYASPEEAQGINSQADLALAVRAMNKQNIQKHQIEGVTIVSPEQTFIAPDVTIGRDTVIHPWTYIERGVRIGRGCEIGPFAKIRSGSVVGDESVIGSFVELTRSRIGKKVLAKHLAYLGDAEVGEGTNIGAGTVTANYDGKRKNRTRIGKKAFIGVDTVFIAPVKIGDQAKTGAGAVLTRGTKVGRGEIFVGVPAHALKKTGKWQRRSSK